jgi:hypothetical protein
LIEGKAVRYRFERGHSNDHSCHVWLNVVNLFPERRFSQDVRSNQAHFACT